MNGDCGGGAVAIALVYRYGPVLSPLNRTAESRTAAHFDLGLHGATFDDAVERLTDQTRSGISSEAPPQTT